MPIWFIYAIAQINARSQEFEDDREWIMKVEEDPRKKRAALIRLATERRRFIIQKLSLAAPFLGADQLNEMADKVLDIGGKLTGVQIVDPSVHIHDENDKYLDALQSGLEIAGALGGVLKSSTTTAGIAPTQPVPTNPENYVGTTPIRRASLDSTDLVLRGSTDSLDTYASDLSRRTSADSLVTAPSLSGSMDSFDSFQGPTSRSGSMDYETPFVMTPRRDSVASLESIPLDSSRRSSTSSINLNELYSPVRAPYWLGRPSGRILPQNPYSWMFGNTDVFGPPETLFSMG
jgi:hypothetical protein